MNVWCRARQEDSALKVNNIRAGSLLDFSDMGFRIFSRESNPVKELEMRRSVVRRSSQSRITIRSRSRGHHEWNLYTQESSMGKSSAVTCVFVDSPAEHALSSRLYFLEYVESSSVLKIEHWLRLLFRRKVILLVMLQPCLGCTVKGGWDL